MTSSNRAAGGAAFPSSGRELVLELKRTTNITSGVAAAAASSGDFAPYNAQLVRRCFQDIQQSFQSLREEMQAMQLQQLSHSQSQSESQNESKSQDEDDDDENDTNSKKPSMNARPSILFHNASIQRQKRCLLAYHKHRMDRIQDIVSSNANNSSNTTHYGDDLFLQHNNVHEADFANDYQQLRQQYAAEIFDLNVLPPTSHMVQVKVVEDLQQQLGGPVVLESGRSVTFTKGSRWYLPRSDVLEYLQGGSMELCDGEEIDF